MVYRRVNLQWSGGSLQRVLVGDGFVARLLGMRAPDTNGVLLWSRSVHMFGLAEPIWVFDVDRAGLVLGATLLRPNRLYRRIQPGLILEVRFGVPVPAVGDQLFALPSVNDGRNTDPLRDTDRQPRRYDSATR